MKVLLGDIKNSKFPFSFSDSLSSKESYNIFILNNFLKFASFICFLEAIVTFLFDNFNK